MKYCFIANPHARNGRGRKKLGQLRVELDRRALRYDWALCENLDHARLLSQAANHSGYDVIVAVGGDGTINRVLNGFFDADGKRLSKARMGAVHIGTSPDFCRSYHIPTEVLPAVATLVKGGVRPISVGRVLYEDETGAALANGLGAAFFGCCANAGLGASLARLANRGIRKYAGDFLGTFVSLLRTLLSYRPHTLHVTLDGETRILRGVYNLSVGKTFYIASGIKVRHALSDRDSRFYVMCLRNLSCANIGQVLWSIYSGRPITPSPCLSLDYAQSVTLAATDGEIELEFDGDPAGSCPCRIEAAPDPLDLIVGEIV
jgi:diacylglycerol kinase family enzyme